MIKFSENSRYLISLCLAIFLKFSPAQSAQSSALGTTAENVDKKRDKKSPPTTATYLKFRIGRAFFMLSKKSVKYDRRSFNFAHFYNRRQECMET